MPGPATSTLRRFPWAVVLDAVGGRSARPAAELQRPPAPGDDRGSSGLAACPKSGRVALGLAITFLLYRQPSAPSGLALAYVLVVLATGLVNIEQHLSLV